MQCIQHECTHTHTHTYTHSLPSLPSTQPPHETPPFAQLVFANKRGWSGLHLQPMLRAVHRMNAAHLESWCTGWWSAEWSCCLLPAKRYISCHSFKHSLKQLDLSCCLLVIEMAGPIKPVLNPSRQQTQKALMSMYLYMLEIHISSAWLTYFW